MGFTAATLLFLKALALWILIQWFLEALTARERRVKPVVSLMRNVNEFTITAGTTLCALLVLLPSFVFVVLEVFRHVQERTRSLPSKSLSDCVARGVTVINELEALGERMRQAVTKLEVDSEDNITTGIRTPEPPILPQRCGNILLAVCRHSESLERLYLALQPPEVDELIYCDCDDFEVRGEKIVSMIGMLRECMERQTEVVQAVDALCPMIPESLTPIEDEGIEDSGFMEC